jgi:RNA polymerase sigma-32 factor
MVSTIAAELDVFEVEVVEMNRRLSGNDHSLNATVGTDPDGERLEKLADGRPTQEAVVIDIEEARRQRSLLRAALTKLSPREREIVVERHLKEQPATLVELSQRYAVSRERIRQIETRAVEKLHRAIHAASSPPLAHSA